MAINTVWGDTRRAMENAMDNLQRWMGDLKARLAVETQQFLARPASMREWLQEKQTFLLATAAQLLRNLPIAIVVAAGVGLLIWVTEPTARAIANTLRPGSVEASQLRQYGRLITPEERAIGAAAIFFLIAIAWPSEPRQKRTDSPKGRHSPTPPRVRRTRRRRRSRR
jgi:hypothetical protein